MSEIEIATSMSELVELSSTDALNKLLNFNGRALLSGERVKTTHVFADLVSKPRPVGAGDNHITPQERIVASKLQGVLGAADYFSSDGEVFLFASVNRPGSLAMHCSTTDLYLFTVDGTLVAVLEGGFDVKGLSADTLTVSDLGSERNWFALFTRFDVGSEFQQVTRVYILKKEPELVLVIRHQANNMSFPIFRSKD